MLTTGSGVTVITALSLKSAVAANATALDRLAMVYVVLEAGVTSTDMGLEDPEKGVPSERVPLQGAVPVKEMLSWAVAPAHMVVVPLKEAVGLS